jgi:hypothetical protein
MGSIHSWRNGLVSPDLLSILPISLLDQCRWMALYAHTRHGQTGFQNTEIIFVNIWPVCNPLLRSAGKHLMSLLQADCLQMNSNEDEEILPLEFIKEELEMIDIYESERSLTRPNKTHRKMMQEHNEVIDISDDSDDSVPPHPASSAPSRASRRSSLRSSFSSRSSVGDHSTRPRKFIPESDNDDNTNIKTKSAPEKRKRKPSLPSSTRESSAIDSELDRVEVKRRRIKGLETDKNGKGKAIETSQKQKRGSEDVKCQGRRRTILKGKGKGRAIIPESEYSESSESDSSINESSDTTSSDDEKDYTNSKTGLVHITRQCHVNRILHLDSFPLYYPPQIDVGSCAFYIKVKDDNEVTKGLADGRVSMNMLAKNMVSCALTHHNLTEACSGSRFMGKGSFIKFHT